MLVRLFLLLAIVPLVELAILLKLAERFHWGPTIALVVATGALGAWLARRAGFKTLARIRADLNKGVMPASAVMEGVLILVAGAVLVTPGVLTDLLGLALLIPPIRLWAGRKLIQTLNHRIVTLHRDGRPPFVDVSAVGRYDRGSIEDGKSS